MVKIEGSSIMSIFKRKKHLETNSMENGVKMITVSDPNSVNTEQFNTIRTNIEFSNADKAIKSIVITSATASEGKSTVAANISVAFARQGKKVLLVDSDLRRPTINATFSIRDPKGLTNFLTEHNMSINDIFYQTTIENLYVMPSGPIPPNPSELIGSKRMEKLIVALQEAFDVVIYDVPPILSVTDAQILSTKVDGTILVVRENKAEKESIRQAVGLINHVRAKIIGTVLNDVKGSEATYYGYYGTEKS